MKPIKSFGEHLELYVLKIAEKVIDLVDAETQRDLVKFIYQIDSSSAEQVVSSDSIPPSSPHTFSELRSDTPVSKILPDYLDDRQQRQFRQSVTDLRDSRILFLQNLLVYRQGQIDSTLRAISNMDDLMERATKNSTVSASKLMGHYQSIHGRLVAYLAILRLSQQKESARVNAILSSE